MEKKSLECERAEEILHRLSDEEVASEDKRFLSGHLSECRACKELESNLGFIRESLGSDIAGLSPNPKTLKNLNAALREKLKQEAKPTPRNTGFFKIRGFALRLGTAAAALAFCFYLYFLIGTTPEKSGQPAQVAVEENQKDSLAKIDSLNDSMKYARKKAVVKNKGPKRRKDSTGFQPGEVVVPVTNAVPK